ncbi:MAG: efflux RND transporter periplasmic adaptor subunit [Burkholderiaceae bacterium]|jgi:cobalt-zinc-cadmium efflux system membrane fusion protein|nr:efflux RND transporter periplasmic adaptor subunit [Burkholderiaceae bacterium]
MNTLNKLDGGRLRAGLAAAAALLALALAGCGGGAKDEHAGEGDKHAEHAGEKKEGKDEHSEAESELTLTSEEAVRAGIKVEEAKPQALGETLTVTATIRPDADRLAHVAARIEGRITAVPAKLGDKVRAGQTLATLDSVAVGEAHAAFNEAQAELGIAEADFKRAESLNAEEIIPRKDYLRAKADRDKAAAALRAATDRLRLLGGSPSASGAAVSAFAVTAPFAGTVIEKKATLGELASPSEPLFSVADLSRVWIQADLPESALAKVRIGANAKVTVPAYPNEVFSGRVGHIGASLDKDTRTVAARIEVANAEGRLKPEMFATATIEVAGEQREAISLPDAAIVLMDGKPTVFVYRQGAYEAAQVEPGERIGGRTVLKSGLMAGDQVVTSGTYALKARKLKSQLGHGH